MPQKYAEYFKEACLVIADSPMASAALSRRLLQLLLREVHKVKPGDLVAEITEALSKLPGHLQELDAIRNIGNFAAHPVKDKSTGEVVEVEPGEAEWLLEILDRLLRHYFSEPAASKKRMADLNAKLKAAGKPDIKI